MSDVSSAKLIASLESVFFINLCKFEDVMSSGERFFGLEKCSERSIIEMTQGDRSFVYLSCLIFGIFFLVGPMNDLTK